MAARGEDISIAIAGPERLAHDGRLDRAGGRLHQHPVPRADLARPVRGVLERLAGRSPAIQVAVGANSPYLLGKELWRETRIPLFEQATDTRSEELKAQGVRPRVWFGERWITSVFDLFEENVRYFPALLPITEDEDPLEVLEDGRHARAARAAAPQRHDLPLEPAGLRRRRRASRTCGSRTGCLGAGPTVADTDRQRGVLLRPGARPRRERAAAVVADVVLRGRGELPRRRRARDRRPRSTGPGSARSAPPSWCCAGCCRWPHEGLASWGARAAESDRLLGIIEQRCLTGTNGAEWFVAADARRAPTSTATTRCGPRSGGLPRQHAHQRAGAHLGVTRGGQSRRSPLPLPAQRRCAGPTSRAG